MSALRELVAGQGCGPGEAGMANPIAALFSQVCHHTRTPYNIRYPRPFMCIRYHISTEIPEPQLMASPASAEPPQGTAPHRSTLGQSRDVCWMQMLDSTRKSEELPGARASLDLRIGAAQRGRVAARAGVHLRHVFPGEPERSPS